MKKDMPVADTEFVDVIPEEPKGNSSATNNKGQAQQNAPGEAYEEYDDLMFDMTTAVIRPADKGKNAKN